MVTITRLTLGRNNGLVGSGEVIGDISRFVEYSPVTPFGLSSCRFINKFSIRTGYGE